MFGGKEIKMYKNNIDIAIIGAGPSGMAAAIELYKQGIHSIKVFERNEKLGGILNQCIHTGFGIDYYKEEMTGPEYAYKMINEFSKLNIPCELNTMVLDISKNKKITVSSKKNGIQNYQARAIIITTGCRERTRENLEIPGTRPAGVFMAGQAQNMINLKNYKIGKNVVIQGSGDIGLIMARRMTIEGYNVIKVLERLPYLSGLLRNKVQCLDDFNIPIEFNTQISKIVGKERVEGVFVKKVDKNFNLIDETEEFIKCDTVLFSVGLIPEVEVGKTAGVEMINNFHPKVNSKFETNVDGIFVSGNSLHIHDLADNASLEGEKVSRFVIEYLNNNNEFKKTLTNKIQYRNLKVNKQFNEKYFSSVGDKLICIICPRGCIVDENHYGCERGKVFYENELKGKKRILTTTIFCEFEGEKQRVPIRSENIIDVKKIPEIKAILRKKKILSDNKFFIEYDGKEFGFDVYKRMSTNYMNYTK